MRFHSIVFVSVSFLSANLAIQAPLLTNLLTRSNNFAREPTFLDSPINPLQKRETKKAAAQRIRAAKLAAFQATRAASVAASAAASSSASAAAAVKSQAALVANLVAASQAAVGTSGSTGTTTTADGGRFVADAQAAISLAAAKNSRCGSDAACANAFAKAGVTFGPNGAAVCNLGTRKCVNGCASGFNFAPDGVTCVATVKQCGVQACGTLTNGFYTCANNTCTPQCNTDTGYSLRVSGGNPVCINSNINASSCGTSGRVCPSSYNGVGTAVCRGGTCSIACPGGTGVRTTHSAGSGGQLYCGA